MSSLYVRTLCDQWATAMNPGANYINTINEEQNEDPSVNWCTLEYQAINTQRETYCSLAETGIVSLLFFGVAGLGWDDLLLLAEPFVTQFISNVDPAGRLSLELLQPPSDFTALDTPSYIVEFGINYTYRYTGV